MSADGVMGDGGHLLDHDDVVPLKCLPRPEGASGAIHLDPETIDARRPDPTPTTPYEPDAAASG